jgi:hypothetical protein
MNRAVGVIAAILLLAPLSGAVAFADRSCEVVEIHATKTDKPKIDPELKDLKKKLKGPFAAFNTFTKLARVKKSLAKNKPFDFDTPKGKTTANLVSVDQPNKKRARVTVDLDLEDDSGSRYVGGRYDIDANDFLLFSYQLSEGESIITAFGCK